MVRSRAGTSFRSPRGANIQAPSGVVLPPARMPLLCASRLLKRWRYVAVWSPELSLSVAIVRVGPAYQEFWAIWDGQTIREHTRMLPGAVDLRDGKVSVHDRDVSIELTLREIDAFQVLTLDDRAYTWTRKQLVQAAGSVRANGLDHRLASVGLVDDSAGYHPRHTRYRWSAGTGIDTQGRSVAWNLVVGINDLPTNSEQTVWVDGLPKQVGRVQIADDLSCVTFTEGGRLDFQAEAVRQKKTNLLVIRSSYRQPFGRFSGTLADLVKLREAYGVMEDHDVYW